MKNPTIRTEIYYKASEQLEKQESRLNRWKGPEGSKRIILAFQRHLFAKGSGNLRVAKILCILRKTAEMSPPLDRLTRDELESVIAQINKHATWSLHTKRDYRRTLKQLYSWYEDLDPRLEDNLQREETRKFYAYVHKNISTVQPRKVLDYSTILTDEDVRELIHKGCKTPMEKALVSVLHETGCRVGELLGMRIRDMERRDRHAMVHLDGKTGPRRVPILQSIPYLQQWIDIHPHKDNPDALLWIASHNRWGGAPLRYVGVKRVLERVYEGAGWLQRAPSRPGKKGMVLGKILWAKKKANPHWFRHSRATILAPKYSESVLCKLMGWTLGSKQVRTYVHLGAGQVEDAFLKNHGLAEQSKPEPIAQFCACGETNAPIARYCFKCGQPLNVGVVLQEQEYLKKAFELLPRILADPELKARYEQKLCENTQK